MSKTLLKTVTKRPRQDKRRARNRQALINAAIELVIAEGPAALTPLRITDRAQLHKRSFYAHFKTIAECLQAVAMHVHDENLARDLEIHRRTHDANLPMDHEIMREAIEQSLYTAQRFARLHELFRRCRHDDSTLGRAMREAQRSACAAWTQIMWDYAMSFGVEAKYLFEIQTMAENIIEYHIVAVDRLIDGHEKDVPKLAARLQRYNRAIVTSELRRMLGLEAIVGDRELGLLQRRMRDRDKLS